ncbi:MAG: iron ABC transporter substrate-binding protein, partial [Dehalococcoidia bacterium]
VGLAAVACGGDSGTASAGGRLTIYSGREEVLVAPVIEQFEKATGINVAVKYGKNSELIATIREEGNNSPADLYFGSDPGALGVISDRLVELPDEILNQVDARFRSRDGKWVGISGRARVVVYNTERLSEADLPSSIFGFTDPQWKGRIGWAPTNGSFQAMVTAMRIVEGEERTRQWLEGIKANAPQEYPKNTPIVAAVAAGEIDVGFVNHYYLYRFLAEEGESFSARNYYLQGGDAGAVVLAAGAGIMDTSKNVEAAEKFLEFMLSPVAQQYFASQTFEYPLVDGVRIEKGLLPLSEIEVPDIDLSNLADLKGTLDLLRETGALP